MLLSPHFELSEFLISETAARQGIDNTPSPAIIENLKKTAELLEQVRTLLGNKPILISSGYRCIQLNRAIGSSDTSQHVEGKAVDFTCPGFGTPIQIAKAIDSHPPIAYDQLIHEFDSWVHISWNPPPRRMALTINNAGTNYGLA